MTSCISKYAVKENPLLAIFIAEVSGFQADCTPKKHQKKNQTKKKNSHKLELRLSYLAPEVI